MLFDPEKIITLYWYLALIGTIIFILKVSLPFDTGSEVSGDFTSITDTDASFQFFTIESISAFFMSGGWMGWASLEHLHYDVKAAVLISVISGILGMLLFTWLVTLLKKLEHTPKASLDELKDRIGKAYTHFDPKGNGKIQIEFNSRLDTIDAVNESEEYIEAFKQIKVTKIENGVVYIVKESE